MELLIEGLAMYRIYNYVENPLLRPTQVWKHRLLSQNLGFGTQSKKLLQEILVAPLDHADYSAKGQFKKLIAEELRFRGFLSDSRKSTEDEREEVLLNNPTDLPEISFYNCPTSHPASLPIDSDLVFLGIPSDLGAKKPGCRRGPEIIRQRSSAFNFRGEEEAGLISLSSGDSVFRSLKCFDVGDFNFPRSSIDEWLRLIERSVDQLPESSVPITIGGDHAFSLSPLRSLARKHPGLKVVQFDHHLDLQVWGEMSEAGPILCDEPVHSNFMSHFVREFPNSEVIHFGPRHYQSIDPENIEFVRSYLKKVGSQVSDLDFYKRSVDSLSNLVGKDQDIYITFDVDALPFYMMSETGYPAGIGIDLMKVFALIEVLIRDNRLRGFDLMEFGSGSQHDSSSAELVTMLLTHVVECIARFK